MTITQLKEELAHSIKQLQASVDAFADKVKLDPDYEMGWAGDVFTVAARLKVAQVTLAMLAKHDLEEVTAETRREVIRSARSPQHSTSPCSNLMSLCRGSAMAEMLEMLEKVSK
jgi:hypothetical protein